MNERPDDLRDDLLGARLKSALGTTPARLASRLRRLTAVGLRSEEPQTRPTPYWPEVLRRSAAMALVLGVLAALLPRIFEWIVSPPPFVHRLVTAPLTRVSPAAVIALILPLGILLVVEALRGAPTVWRWVR